MIIIFVRKTEDWENYTIKDFLKQTDLGSNFLIDNELSKKIYSLIQKWDNNFKIPYFKYRGCLKNLSQKTFKNYKVFYNFEELLNAVGNDDFVFATDDDDWYRNDLIECVPELIGDSDLLFWNHVVHCTHEFGPHLWYDFHENMGSNNYCLKGSFFKKFNYEEQKKLILNENLVLQITKKQNAKIKYVNYLLSCYVWHMGSISFMTQTNNNNFYKKYKKLKNYKLSNDQKNMEWTMEYFDELASIHNQLKDDLKCL